MDSPGENLPRRLTLKIRETDPQTKIQQLCQSLISSASTLTKIHLKSDLPGHQFKQILATVSLDLPNLNTLIVTVDEAAQFVDHMIYLLRHEQLRLKNFAIIQTHLPLHIVTPTKELMERLPSKKTMETLSLTGPGLCGLLSQPRPLNPDYIPDFTALSELKLVEITGVSNEFLQAICQHLPQLTVLIMCRIPGTSDKGFLGPSLGANANEPSLRNLKSLRILSLKSVGITNRTVQRGIIFDNIRNISLQDRGLSPMGLIQHLLSQNPNLRSLSTSVNYQYAFNQILKFRKTLRRDHPLEIYNNERLNFSNFPPRQI